MSIYLKVFTESNMARRDPHTALQHKVLGEADSSGADLSLVKLQWSKEGIGYSLHVAPRTHSLVGVQITDFLNYLGFKRSRCPFVSRGECYVHWVEADFDVHSFAESFQSSYGLLTSALKELEKCGLYLDQPEGWGYFSRSPSKFITHSGPILGDGHNAISVKRLKQSEDASYCYCLTFLTSDSCKGWVKHYRPKQTPSLELQSALKFLGLKEFQGCPEYDFEPCYWYSILARNVSPIERNGHDFMVVKRVFNSFEAHEQHFLPGLQGLLEVHRIIQNCGFSFLPIHKQEGFQSSSSDIEAKPELRQTKSKSVARKLQDNNSYDVALSFAADEREHAEELATILEGEGFSVFYDKFYEANLWGKDLTDYFDKIYRKQSRYCVIFVSQAYKDRIWTIYELRSARARLLQEKGKEYILPIVVDAVELDGIPPTIKFVDLKTGIKEIADMLIEKLRN